MPAAATAPSPASRDLFDPSEPALAKPVDAAPQADPSASDATARPRPVDALRQSLARGDERPAAPMSLYAVYVLILLAVPTLGLAAVLALLAVTGRDGPRDALPASHFVYQQRTLWIAAVAVALGGLLVIVNIGVFVLFLAALWVLARGVYGVLRLKAGLPIKDPRSWLF